MVKKWSLKEILNDLVPLKYLINLNQDLDLGVVFNQNKEEIIENLTKRVNACLKMSFREFAKVGSEKKVNVIVGFLAMLELVKQGVIAVTQDKNFGDIEMETENLGVPKY